jgi:dolichol-phosphate mannosyltransferase
VNPAFDLSVIIPTKNEAGNIGELIARARRVIDKLGIRAEIVTVDGNSADATCEEAEAAGAVAIRDGGNCYGDALRTGFARAGGAYVLTMDSDLSHEPEFLEQMWSLREEADIIIASRYVPGGTAEMSVFRGVLSRVLNLVFIGILRVPVKDISSGYRLYRKQVLEELPIAARDFDVLEEILIRLHVAGRRIREVPFHYRPRKEGKSNAKLARFAVAYLKTLGKMIWLRWAKPACDG